MVLTFSMLSIRIIPFEFQKMLAMILPVYTLLFGLNHRLPATALAAIWFPVKPATFLDESWMSWLIVSYNVRKDSNHALSKVKLSLSSLGQFVAKDNLDLSL